MVMHTCNAHMLCTCLLYLVGLITRHSHSLCAQHSDTVHSMVLRTRIVCWCVCVATILRAHPPLLASMHAWYAYTSMHVLRAPVMHTLYTWCSYVWHMHVLCYCNYAWHIYAAYIYCVHILRTHVYIAHAYCMPVLYM